MCSNGMATHPVLVHKRHMLIDVIFNVKFDAWRPHIRNVNVSVLRHHMHRCSNFSFKWWAVEFFEVANKGRKRGFIMACRW